MDILELKEKVISGCISEDIIIEYCDTKNLTTLQFSTICEELLQDGISIVSSEEYNCCKDNNANQSDVREKLKEPDLEFSTIVNQFLNLDIEQKKRCLALLSDIIIQETRQEPNLKKRFIEVLSQKKLQYSYIAVLLKAFFEVSDSNGVAQMSSVIEYFECFYMDRKRNGLIIEQKDSLFSKNQFNKNDIRKIVLFNPLKRSFLKEYFYYNKENDSIISNSILWNSLTNDDIQKIIGLANSSLMKYYDRLNNQDVF